MIRIYDEELTSLPKDLYIDPQALQILLEMFEGPLDLLLYLIRRQNLDILAIPIAQITRQYIAYINAMQTLNINLAGEYLLMAATLLLIKSRMLLPKPPTIEEVLSDELDPRQELIKRLIEYEKIKLAAQTIAQIPQAQRDYLWLNILPNDLYAELPQVSSADLARAWQTLLLKSITPKKHQIKRQELSVREHMSEILRQLSHTTRASFYSLFDPSLGVGHIVVNFIAILELTKEGLITLIIDEDEITVGLI